MDFLRRGEERGRTTLDWLDSRHTFSFGQYYDPEHMGFASLRVINEDTVAPGAGFPAHHHRDMEIITYVISGALTHEDSLGNGSTLRAGEFQCMTAGTGISHSEFNASRTEPVHFLQIWLVPDTDGLEPGWKQRGFDVHDDELCLVASSDARKSSLRLHLPADLYLGRVRHDDSVAFSLRDERCAWLHVISGTLEADGVALTGGDAVGFPAGGEIAILGSADADFLLFDLE